jgi:hypothetical protein
MKCREMKVMLSAYVNGELSEAEIDKVERHLAGCAECRSVLEVYRNVRQKVSALQSSLDTGDIKEAVMADIRAEVASRKPSLKWLKPALVGIPVLITIIAGLLVWQPWNGAGKSNGFIASVKAAANGLQYYKAHTVNEVSQGYNANTIIYDVAFAAPDRYRIEARDNTVSGGNVYIGKKVYSWGEQPVIPQFKMTGISGAHISSIGFPTKNEIKQMIDSLKDMEQFPDEAIDGVVCLHYRGEIVSGDDYEKRLSELDPNDLSYPVMKDLIDKMYGWSRSQKREIEIWIGKDDYLPRKERYYTYIPPYTAQDEAYTMTRTTIYYDFNIPVEIEPPLDAEGNLISGSSLDIDYELLSKYALNGSQHMGIEGEDPAHQKINFSTTITNHSTETVRNVRILVSSITTSGQEVPEIMELLPLSGGQVDLGPGESETFSLSWEFASEGANNSLSEVLNATEVEARYITSDGEEFIQPFPYHAAATTPSIP